MAFTLEELKEYLAKQVNEVDILELLNISSEDIVNAFHDVIDQKYDYLLKELELDEETEETY